MCLSFVLFNADSLTRAAGDFAALFGLAGLPLVTEETLYYLGSYLVLFIIACFGATCVPKTWAERTRKCRFCAAMEPFFLLAVLLISTAYLVDGSFSPFLYFRF